MNAAVYGSRCACRCSITVGQQPKKCYLPHANQRVLLCLSCAKQLDQCVQVHCVECTSICWDTNPAATLHSSQ